jgi:hypothetical protein
MSNTIRDERGCFLKGTPRIGGRAKGVANKSTIEIKQAIEQVFEGMGGIPALLKWANDNPTLFYTNIWSKLLPASLKVEATITDFTSILEKARLRVIDVKPIKLEGGDGL